MLTGPAKDLKIAIDQINLEPFIPNISHDGPKPEVIVLKGMYKGKSATLTELDSASQMGILQLNTDPAEALKLEYD